MHKFILLNGPKRCAAASSIAKMHGVRGRTYSLKLKIK
jgi:hypothetical protein